MERGAFFAPSVGSLFYPETIIASDSIEAARNERATINFNITWLDALAASRNIFRRMIRILQMQYNVTWLRIALLNSSIST